MYSAKKLFILCNGLVKRLLDLNGQLYFTNINLHSQSTYMPRLTSSDIDLLSDEHGHELKDGHLIIEGENQAEQKEKLRLSQERRDAITARLREFLTEPNDDGAGVEDERFGSPYDIFNKNERVSLDNGLSGASSLEDRMANAETLLEMGNIPGRRETIYSALNA